LSYTNSDSDNRYGIGNYAKHDMMKMRVAKLELFVPEQRRLILSLLSIDESTSMSAQPEVYFICCQTQMIEMPFHALIREIKEEKTNNGVELQLVSNRGCVFRIRCEKVEKVYLNE
jgi:hypothetical protein